MRGAGRLVSRAETNAENFLVVRRVPCAEKKPGQISRRGEDTESSSLYETASGTS